MLHCSKLSEVRTMPRLSRTIALVASAAVIAGGAYAAWRYFGGTGGPAPTHADLAYADVSARNVLDIYLPEGAGPFPFVVDIHGGAFRMGDKAGEPVAQEILNAGIAVVRPNYRYSTDAVWPAQGEDLMAAMGWLAANGEEYGLDPARVALWGQSAGGFLAVSTALSLVEAGTPPRAVVDFYGPMDFARMDEDMTALGRTAAMGTADGAESAESVLLGYAVGENRAAATAMGPVGRLAAVGSVDLPPIMIRHGDADTFIAHLQSERLRDAWVAADPEAVVDFALVPGAGHGGGDFDTDVVVAPLVAFLAENLR
jgi:acetyl esterase/lipase